MEVPATLLGIGFRRVRLALQANAAHLFAGADSPEGNQEQCLDRFSLASLPSKRVLDPSEQLGGVQVIAKLCVCLSCAQGNARLWARP